MSEKSKSSVQTLVGIVTPHNWNENDRVCEVSLSATDDREYVIQNSERFLDLVQTPIRATGVVTLGKKTHRRINIKKFQVLDSTTLFEQVHPEYSRATGGSGSRRRDEEYPSPKH